MVYEYVINGLLLVANAKTFFPFLKTPFFTVYFESFSLQDRYGYTWFLSRDISQLRIILP